MKTYEQGDAVRIEITVKQRTGRTWVLYNPSSGCQVTLYDPNKVAVITSQSMSNEGTGLYYYNWQSTAITGRGVYVARIVADDGSTQGTRADRLFELK